MNQPLQLIRSKQNFYSIHQNVDYHPQEQFGVTKWGKKSNPPKCTFGKSTREDDTKQFVNGRIAACDRMGVFTPNGPKYHLTDRYSYSRSPEWRISRSPRPKLATEAQYEYYQQQRDNIYLTEADRVRRPKTSSTRFGSQSRFRGEKVQSPGPKYNVGKKLGEGKQNGCSIGVRRSVKGADGLFFMGCSGEVGPGDYHTQESEKVDSTRKVEPKWSIPRGPKMAGSRSDSSLHQTYASSSAMGTQVRSGKESRPKYSINKTSRESRGLVLKAHMQFRPMAVRLAHPVI